MPCLALICEAEHLIENHVTAVSASRPGRSGGIPRARAREGPADHPQESRPGRAGGKIHDLAASHPFASRHFPFFPFPKPLATPEFFPTLKGRHHGATDPHREQRESCPR